ncbi:LysR family transcriptional regulator [Brucellaceae bacterium C25G]
MTLEQLRIFIAVAEKEHLTQAAGELHLTPSAVSSAIRTLEDRYSATLFNRIGRRIELTDDGRIFLDEARATLARARAAELTLSELGGLKRGSLTIFASQTIASYFLPPLLARFKSLFPSILVDLHIGNTHSVAQATSEGGADLGFVEGIIYEQGLQIQGIGEDQLVLVVGKNHPWIMNPPTGYAGLMQSGQWILREQGSGTRAVFEEAIRAQGYLPEQLKIALELPSNEAVCSAVQSGTYATVISELAAAPHLLSGNLIKIALPLPKRQFLLLTHKERYRTKAAQALIDLLPK